MKKLLSLLATTAVVTGAATGILNSNASTTVNSKINEKVNATATDLGSVITITKLGSITMAGSLPTKAELLTGIQNVNTGAGKLTTSDFILLDTTTPSSVVIVGVGNYSGEVFLQYSKQLTALNTIITTTELGTIDFNGSVPTKAELLKGIQNVNTGASALTTEDFELDDTPTQDSATIIAVGNYSGTIKLTFSQTDTRVDISTIITTTDLGTIETGGAAPTKAQLLTAIQAVNPNASNLTTADFGFDDNPTTTGVTIYGISDDFKGQVALTYTVS